MKYIAKNHSEISNLRGDEKRFNYEDFINFSRKNINKYSLIESGGDLLVSTWYSDELIKDYKQTINN